MIQVKFLGGAKKSFPEGSITIEKNNLTVQELLDYLILKKPTNTPELDTENILIAINGADSSAVGGKSAKLNSGDEVTIIPVIHGGSPRIQFQIGKSQVEIFTVTSENDSINLLDELRKKFPKLVLQAISKNFVLNKSHIQKILQISLESQKANLLLSKKLETDILMRFAGTSQISQAISKIGIDQKNDFILIAIGPKSSLNKLRTLLKPIFSKKSFIKNNEKFLMKEFKITKKHLDSVDSKTPLEDILAEQAAVLF